MEQTFRDDPEMCRAFAAASLRGWLYAFEHEQETLEIVMKYAQAAHTGTNKAHQRWMLARMKDLILSSGDTERVGKLRPADYELVGGVLKEFRLIDNLPNFDDFYRGQK
jgi:NitT/TauT family transport system substrate-binding protein